MSDDAVREVVGRLRALPAAELWADGGLTIERAMKEFTTGRTSLYRLMSAGLPFSMATGRRVIPRRALVELFAAGCPNVAQLQVA